MKPTPQQLQTIKNILGSASKYRETYEELYDHILSALEAVPDEVPFTDALYNIFENQLGGKREIAVIEAKYRRVAIKEIVKKYFTYFGRFLVSPVIILVIACSAFFYWEAVRYSTSGLVINVVMCSVCVLMHNIPDLFRWLQTAETRRLGYYGKSSIVSIAYPVLRNLPSVWCMPISIIYLVYGLKSLPFLSPYIATVIFFVSMLNALTYYRLCKDEFKVITTK